MKYLLPFALIVLLASCQQRNYPAGKEPKSIIIPSEMMVTKLMMDGDEKTEELGRVRLTDKQWSEYDREGNVIGVAEIVSINNRTIEVKWTLAENGAEVGENTFYDYHILTDKVIFTIWHKNTQKGYFEASLNED
ncbi:hypothetical protein E1176_11650 [Fulvivirga sp. RKSG066]|uniref:hypothetical protein n=1 Tax=Fulvivirga aurantia TaxID=2529383 RepID=UPI0012BC6FDE|nr:hypothetical protein [Fulvivirga aurantia]MTI21676.1 hypothetical protein [Fulvivirga aurantia]